MEEREYLRKDRFPNFTIVVFSHSSKTMMFSIFVLVWTSSLILSMAKFTINLATCMWYHDSTTHVSSITRTSLWWTIRYHFGTLCFGSIVLSVTEVLGRTCKYLLTKSPGAESLSGLSKLPAMCLTCLIGIAEKMIKYFTSQVYTEVALSSEPFCVSAKRTANFMEISLFRFETACEILIFLARMAISTTTTIICYKIMNMERPIFDGMVTIGNTRLITHLIIFVLSWFVSSVFVFVWEASSDTIINLQILEKKRGSAPSDKVGDSVLDALKNAEKSEAI